MSLLIRIIHDQLLHYIKYSRFVFSSTRKERNLVYGNESLVAAITAYANRGTQRAITYAWNKNIQRAPATEENSNSDYHKIHIACFLIYHQLFTYNTPKSLNNAFMNIYNQKFLRYINFFINTRESVSKTLHTYLLPGNQFVWIKNTHDTVLRFLVKIIQ